MKGSGKEKIIILIIEIIEKDKPKTFEVDSFSDSYLAFLDSIIFGMDLEKYWVINEIF